jgi:hypothetical protein
MESAVTGAIVRPPTTAEAERLRGCFRAAAYEEAAVCERLGIGSIVAVEPLHVPLYLRRLEPPDPQGALIRLFLLQREVSAVELRAAFSAEDVGLLVELGLAEGRGEMLAPLIDLYPYGEDWLATDRSDRAGEGSACGPVDAVMPLNMSSHTLAQIVLPVRVESVLDVGTGCGVHAIRAARRAVRVVATDLNPRALRFAAFNAALNGVTNIEFREGDLWDPVRGERFDQIVANPAFSLSGETEFLFRDGGARGDRMTRALLAGAVEHLREGGVAQVIGEFPTIGGRGFEEWVEEWVGDAPCDRLLLRFGAMEPLEYGVAYAHQAFEQRPAEYEAKLGARLKDFAALGIQDVVLGAVLLRSWNEAAGRGACWAARRVLPAPEQFVGGALIDLIGALDRWESEDAPRELWEGAPRMAPELTLTETRVWKGDRWEEGEVRISAAGNPFCHDLQLSGPARELLTLCDGTRRGSEIAAAFADGYQLAEEEAAETALAFLKELVEQGLVSVEAEAVVPPAGSGGRRTGEDG